MTRLLRWLARSWDVVPLYLRWLACVLAVSAALRYAMHYGSWWAVQGPNGGLSLGVHVDLRRRRTNAGVRYGPYVDLHLLCWVISVGVNPIYAGELDLVRSFSRGGLSAAEH